MSKRIFDIAVSTALIVILAPLLVVVAVAVRVTSPGPIFHRARRVGRNGQLFTLYKFRSMVANADKIGPGITACDDTRITSVGHLLRQLKFDELPQLFNVLRGDMSLVGPRPEDPRYVALYTEEQRRILSVRPGITSPASLGFKNEQLMLSGADWEQQYVQEIMPAKLRIDLKYLDTASLVHDFRVLLGTLFVFSNRRWSFLSPFHNSPSESSDSNEAKPCPVARNYSQVGAKMLTQLKNHRVFMGGRVRWTLGWAILDGAIVLAAYASFAIVPAASGAAPDNLSLFPDFIAFVIGVMLSMNYMFGVYRRIWSRTSGHEVGVILKAGGVTTLVTLAADELILNTRLLPPDAIMLANGLSVVGFVMVRYRGRLLSGFVWRWRAIWFHEFPALTSRVLIVGAGQSGQMTAWRLKHGSPRDVDYCVVGFVDEDSTKHGMYVEGSLVLGSYQAIPQLARQHQIDLIVIALPTISGPRFREIISHCEDTDARIKVMHDIFEVLDRTERVPFLRDVEAADFLDRKPVGHHPAVDLAPVTHKNVLVTGAAGSIGSELSRQLMVLDPAKLLLVDNNESDLHDLTISIEAKFPEYVGRVIAILADVTNHDEIERVFTQHKPHVVFHSAAYKHVPMLENYPNKAMDINVNGTWCVAELAQLYAAERFVLISSDKAVCPANVMGATKRICEMLMLALSRQGGGGTLFTAVRFGNVLGSRGSVMPIFNRQIEAGGPVTITDRNMRRYFMTIPEAANLVIHAACLTKGGDLFMLNMGNEIRIVDLAERMIRLRGLRPYEDIEIKFVGIRPGEKLYEDLHAHSEVLQPTPHPEIFQLVDNGLQFQPQVFLQQISKLQKVRYWKNGEIRIPLMALAHLEDLALEVEEITDPGDESLPERVPNPIPSDIANSQVWIRSIDNNNNRSQQGQSLM